ncbi:MAG: hypothetical protein ACR2I5_07770 [Candidatus Limnocylindria bacterium]
MRLGRVLLGLCLALALAPPALADVGLIDEIAGAYFPRYADARLHQIAHERLAELSTCDCLEHDGIRAGTAEVIAYNAGIANPVSAVVSRWADSPIHDGILSDWSYGRIGCAELVGGGVHWFACVLAAGPLPPAATSSGPGPFLLPDTAMALPTATRRPWPAFALR